MRIVSLLFCLLWLIVGAEEHSKIVYLKYNPPKFEGRELYVGEKIEVKYTLLLFSNATLADVEFIPNGNKKLSEGAELLNPQSAWKKISDDTYENTFVFKIKSPNFAIPTLQITAVPKDGDYSDMAIADGVVMEAVDLGGEYYCKVVAQKMQVSNLQARKYDEWNNIVIFDVNAQKSNLEDFHIPNIERQGYDGDLLASKDTLRGTYYAVIPKDIQELRISYFNLELLRYEEIVVPIVVKSERVSTQSDLEPKNTFLIFSNIVLVALAVILLGCAFFFRKQRIIAIVLIVCALGMLVYVFLKFEGNKVMSLRQDSSVAILPTRNSTILERIPAGSSVEVIGEHGEYYKIKLNDSRIGWVSKNDCN